jgi:hypothetical protein
MNFELIRHPPNENKKAEPLLGAAFVNWDQVLGGGCNSEIAACGYITTFRRGSKVLICWSNSNFGKPSFVTLK